MLPYLDEIYRLNDVSGADIRAALTLSLSGLASPEAPTNPHGRFLQVSSTMAFTWYAPPA